jgi:phosphoglycolate phosphatase-like HAD superfamily hydrolase
MVRKSVETFSRKNNENKTGGAKKSMKKRKMGKKLRVQSRKSKGKKMSKKLKDGGYKFPWTRRKNNNNDQSQKAIFFDVDGTLSSFGNCGGTEHFGEKGMKQDLKNLLAELKRQGFYLFILTRCKLERNIEKNYAYYNDIKPFFDKLIGAKELNIDTNTPDSSVPENGRTVWAYVKSQVMYTIAEQLRIEPQDIYLIDDDRVNAKVASVYGFNVITTYDEASSNDSEKHGGLTMTLNGLKQIFNDHNIPIPITPYFDDSNKLDFQIPEYQLPVDLNDSIITYVGNNFGNNVSNEYTYSGDSDEVPV